MDRLNEGEGKVLSCSRTAMKNLSRKDGIRNKLPFGSHSCDTYLRQELAMDARTSRRKYGR